MPDQGNMPVPAQQAPATANTNSQVSSAVNTNMLEITEDERAALSGMSGLQKAVLLMLSLSEDDAAGIFKKLQPKQVQKLGMSMSQAGHFSQAFESGTWQFRIRASCLGGGFR